MWTLKKEFIIEPAEKEFLAKLPDNMPDTKLKKTEIDRINSIYHKYIGKTIDNQDWSENLDAENQREKWPSGPRVKRHESQRMILDELVRVNDKKALTEEEAARKFHCLLKGIKNHCLVINYYCWERK